MKSLLPQSYKQLAYKGKEVLGYEGKLKNTFKRCGQLLNDLGNELKTHERKTLQRQSWQNVEPGDACEIIYRDTALTTSRTTMISGVCVGVKRPKLPTASFRILAYMSDEPVEFDFPLYSPLIVDYRLTSKRYITKGVRRPKSAKLYYLKNTPHLVANVPPSAITKAETEEKLVNARIVSYENRMGKKERTEKAEKEKKMQAKKAELEAKKAATAAQPNSKPVLL
ncbi:hypothetical protein BASA81_007532 [Batrachochytrium salamandrivorans]|nr:hypothetical protein BASA81_007532 [Batrachochytrium salamandrivorans]